MVESILSTVSVLALLGIIFKLFYNRMNRLENKVDWLIMRNGGGYQPKVRTKKGVNNESTS